MHCIQLQSTVSTSSTEAEYNALSAIVSELKWLTMLLNEITGMTVPINLYSDNQATIALVNSDGPSERTKHIDIKHHYIKDAIRYSNIKLSWISTTDQLADLLTKPLGRVLHTSLVDRIMSSTSTTT